ncbi:GNAT family N-acetyltransferase [Dactylosporangium aurantiacum]|uniref:GNAT family N-acetyltransferase n=1 Tax=Dactylosporangium aurantiacum TaxID=35754 RepID=A0A9Q9ML13_9ACTN|nr:GNAT family N-acetyltransferase [Dactylosporangium aurantiacum]MDG6109710.1 GNAT family N-acetyltransferase [Dactylosporangium aurantiacum]UWZ56351.1 GNAT family N-acetyltransferase [Dactylosporangium aurantiacum]
MLRTDRLVLRRWQDEDRAPFAALNADPDVMRFFPRPLSRAESYLMIDRIEAAFDEHGYGLWAVEVVQPDGKDLTGPDETAGLGRDEAGLTRPDGTGFIGFVGLVWQRFPAHFTPALEIGWRLPRHAWGHGYATEAATAARDFAFRPAADGGAGMDEIVSITTRTNEPSQAVMRRIGMTRDPADDFRHPNLEPDHPLVEHVLYRLRRPAAGHRDE